MTIINPNEITKTVATLCTSANIHLGDDIKDALKTARDLEISTPTHSTLAHSALETMLKNAEIASRENLPICQDTGMAVVFVEIGQGVYIDGDVNDAINEGVRQGYLAGFCRNSIVRDPIHRQNTGDNTPAVIHYEFASADNASADAMKGKLRITVAPKGFGSENMSAVRMLNPSDGLPGVEDFVVETVRNAGANPCPPIVVGVGVGGTMEKAALLAKKALLRKVTPNTQATPSHSESSLHNDRLWPETEARLLSRINDLDIGPCGYGGRTTALGVHILTYPTHIAGLPVAVNINCHVSRHRSAEIGGENDKAEY